MPSIRRPVPGSEERRRAMPEPVEPGETDSPGSGSRMPSVGSAESAWKLLDDAGAEHVGHLEDVVVDCLVVANVGVVIAAEAVSGLAEGLVEVASHHAAQL